MFRLQHFPLAGGSESTFRGTAVSLTHFQVCCFHWTWLAMPVGSSAAGERYFGHTSIPWQTDMTITERKVTIMELTKQRSTFSCSCLGRQLCSFIQAGGRKEKKKEGVAEVFFKKKAVFSASSSLNFACKGWRLWTLLLAEFPGWILDVD